MKVKDGLAGVRADVEHGAPPLGQTGAGGELAGHHEQMAHQAGVALLERVQRGDMLTRDDERVGGGLGIAVRKGERTIVLKENRGRDLTGRDLAK